MWTMDGPTPYFGGDDLFYVIRNDTGQEPITILIDATPLSDYLNDVATRIFEAIKQGDNNALPCNHSKD